MLANSFPFTVCIGGRSLDQQYTAASSRHSSSSGSSNDIHSHGTNCEASPSSSGSSNSSSCESAHSGGHESAIQGLSGSVNRSRQPLGHYTSDYMYTTSPQAIVASPVSFLPSSHGYLSSSSPTVTSESPTVPADPTLGHTPHGLRQRSFSPPPMPNAYMTPMPSNVKLFSQPTQPPVKNLRCSVVLEAPPATTTHRTEDGPLTYLNKGQFYCISLKDAQQCDVEICTTVAIMFHDNSHQTMARSYWRTWMGQQKEHTPRAVDIDMARSQDIHGVKLTAFDRVTFNWNGQKGATLYLRFNCLSTDFSRIKGVKGIPLRIHVESQATLGDAGHMLEATYCKIKLFRDKGAERKNKDDAKHIEKQIEKMRATKHTEAYQYWLSFCRQSQPYTIFTEIPNFLLASTPGTDILSDSPCHPHRSSQNYTGTPPTPAARVLLETPSGAARVSPILSGAAAGVPLSTAHPLPSASPKGNNNSNNSGSTSNSTIHPSSPFSSIGVKRTRDEYMLHSVSSLDTSSSDNACSLAFVNHTSTAQTQHNATPIAATPHHHSICNVLDIDPTHVPLPKRRTAKRGFFARFPSSDLYRAIYLDHLTVQDLVEKLSSKMELTLPVSNVVRQVIKKDSNALTVHVDDAMVQDIPEEQDMEVETKIQKDDALTLVLRY